VDLVKLPYPVSGRVDKTALNDRRIDARNQNVQSIQAVSRNAVALPVDAFGCWKTLVP
jgi:hypothetical protein